MKILRNGQWVELSKKPSELVQIGMQEKREAARKSQLESDRQEAVEMHQLARILGDRSLIKMYKDAAGRLGVEL